ncbi:MAG: SPOR domain-containing protein, partial [Deferrisomatales bacterium]|nr:SPOR domain-containing protein [Deferrisomatales bacterium]
PTPGTRFGPEVREVAVAVAATDTRPPPAPESPAEPSAAPEPVPPGEPAAEAPAPETTPPATVVRPTAPAAAPAAAAPASAPDATAAAPVATGSHALQVGMFGSQKYRHAMEQQLEEAGLPHFRRQRSKPGEGFRLTLPLSDAEQREKARTTLDAAGVLYNLQGDSLEALFHFEAEAQRALQKLSDAGLNGGYAKTQGELPLWIVYAGPFTLEEAKRVRQQLAILGLPSYLRNAP